MIEINDKRFDNKHFNNRECIYSEQRLSEESNTITLLWESNADIGSLVMAVNYIRDRVPYTAKLNLEMPYIPYSAMDRQINDQLPSAIYFADFINSLQFDRIDVLDPHSEVIVKCLKNKTDLREIPLQPIIDKVINETSPDFIYYPDKGAYNKYPNKINTHGIPYFHGYKFRDLKNKGELSPEMQIELCGISVEELKESHVLIIDDICRKGGTAYYAAKNLKKLGVGKVSLYVSHCEDCITQGEIFKTDEISAVYTTDSEYAIAKVEDRQPKLRIVHSFYRII